MVQLFSSHHEINHIKSIKIFITSANFVKNVKGKKEMHRKSAWQYVDELIYLAKLLVPKYQLKVVPVTSIFHYATLAVI